MSKGGGGLIGLDNLGHEREGSQKMTKFSWTTFMESPLEDDSEGTLTPSTAMNTVPTEDNENDLVLTTFPTTTKATRLNYYKSNECCRLMIH